MPRFSSPDEPGPAPAPSSYPRGGAKPLFPTARDRYGRDSNAKKPIHMLLTTTGGASFTVVLPDEQATMRLMVDVASALEPGDVLTLSGDLGAGKTTFARAMIRYLAGDETIEVPSPTFTLMQTYELPRFPVVHADLYRLSGSAELAELGFDDLPDGAVVVVEWPDRAAGFLPADRIDVTLTLAPKLKPEFRHARVTGYGTCAKRVDRIASVRQFIAEAGFSEATRERMPGDASTRRYHRLILGSRRSILMDSPRRPDGPPVRDGKPYSQIAHLAEVGGAVCRDGQGTARAGPDRTRDPARRHAAGPAHHRGPRQRGRGRGRPAGADRRALRDRGRCLADAARQGTARRAAGRAACRA